MISLDSFVATPGALTRGNSYKSILERAFSILKDPERWTQGGHARAPDGELVKPKDPRACKWCLLGAVAIESNELAMIPPPLMRFLDQMVAYIYGDKFVSVGEMNDYIDHDLLIDFMSKTMARFEPGAS